MTIFHFRGTGGLWFVVSIAAMGLTGFRLFKGFKTGKMETGAWKHWGWAWSDRATDPFGFWGYAVLYAAFFAGFPGLAIHVVIHGDL
jgi:hypothetical protein